ncbi:MAG: hypothetical protein FWD12_04950, partial [Alphaproteobacteria bacterium]|nr:hypothetical protein [Alphaproteobacteria bacterium]
FGRACLARQRGWIGPHACDPKGPGGRERSSLSAAVDGVEVDGAPQILTHIRYRARPRSPLYSIGLFP